MSTITSRPPTARPSAPAPQLRADLAVDQRIVIRDIPWDIYDRLSDAIGEGQHIHLAYDGRDLEIMSTGREHEDFKDLLGRFVNAVTDDLHILSRAVGETTWKRAEIERGLEADLSYYFVLEKLAQDREARKRRSRNIADYPNPDLAVEIDISPFQIDRPGIYQALRVAEIWRFDGSSVSIEQLGPDGTYVAAERSMFLPILASEIVRWIIEEDTDDLPAWRERLRAWVLAELAPRMKT
jgi:Uma2 family endonuclease